jgi:hypothetical protein
VVSHGQPEGTKRQGVPAFQFWQSLAMSAILAISSGSLDFANLFPVPAILATSKKCFKFVHSPVTLSPQPHPPWPLLLKTKAKVPFDRTVTDQSKAFFRVFSTSNRVQSSSLPQSVNLPFS